MNLTDFFNRIAAENAERPGTHTLHPGATDAELAAWYAGHIGKRLPDDLVALMRRSNGLGVWQDWYEGEPIFDEGAYRFFSLREIKRADKAMYGERINDPRVRKTWLAFCIGPDSGIYFGFDTKTLHYWKIEPIVPDESEDLGPEIGPVFEMVTG